MPVHCPDDDELVSIVPGCCSWRSFSWVFPALFPSSSRPPASLGRSSTQGPSLDTRRWQLILFILYPPLNHVHLWWWALAEPQGYQLLGQLVYLHHPAARQKELNKVKCWQARVQILGPKGLPEFGVNMCTYRVSGAFRHREQCCCDLISGLLGLQKASSQCKSKVCPYCPMRKLFLFLSLVFKSALFIIFILSLKILFFWTTFSATGQTELFKTWILGAVDVDSIFVFLTQYLT